MLQGSKILYHKSLSIFTLIQYIGLLSIKRILTEFRPQIKSLLLTLLVTSYYARQIKSSPPSTGSQKVSPGPFRRSGVACVRVYFWKRSGAVFSKKSCNSQANTRGRWTLQRSTVICQRWLFCLGIVTTRSGINKITYRTLLLISQW